LRLPLADGSLDRLDPPLADVGREGVERGRRQNHGRSRHESQSGEVPRGHGGCGPAQDEQQRPNRSDGYGEPACAVAAAAGDALEPNGLIASQMAAAVLGQRLGVKRLGVIGHRLSSDVVSTARHSTTANPCGASRFIMLNRNRGRKLRPLCLRLGAVGVPESRRRQGEGEQT
jgi:hypothetical protein